MQYLVPKIFLFVFVSSLLKSIYAKIIMLTVVHLLSPSRASQPLACRKGRTKASVSWLAWVKKALALSKVEASHHNSGVVMTM